MSPAAKSKSKSKDKSSSRAAKEQKATSKVTGPMNGGTGSSASAYNPVSGTFHVLEVSSPGSSPPSRSNGRFQTIDDTKEHSSSPHGTLSEYDSVSNNDSCSGESEDSKDKMVGPNSKQEILTSVDNDRREKIRLKNEKKHQRQRERRAQELHERCSGYLMSRKLEALSRQLVAMGFSSERATQALIHNEGRLEDSISWLFDASEEAFENINDLGSKGDLKIDISKELSEISELEAKYKCSKPEVERAVVACEGDLAKAEEMLRSQKQDLLTMPPEPEATTGTQGLARAWDKSAASGAGSQTRSDRDFNYPRAVPISLEHGMSNLRLHPSKTNHQIQVAEKRWPPVGLNSSPPTSTVCVQVSPTLPKLEVHGTPEDNMVSQPAGREQVLTMQHHSNPAIPLTNMASAVSASLAGFPGFYASDAPSIEMLRPNIKLLHAQRLASLAQDNRVSEQLYHQSAYKELDSSAELGSSWTPMGRIPSQTMPSNHHQGSWGKIGLSPSLYAHTETTSPSWGLYSSGWRSSGSLSSPSQVDWNSPEFDYNSIDWTLDATSKSSGMWVGLSSMLRNSNSGMSFGVPVNRMQLSDWREHGGAEGSSVAPAHEWTSPFAGKDIFSLPRQFVTSPSP
ncbi:hypothetical protein MLD38_002730 [Melastoma candidum]|uniref:Uncharacterized protein n=1 Tax=Melastoma candidum TaxID=119954 RepID=A0ACB9S4Q7_9MYRT|nr:hypothetical protein MLD38_002730 [Melastoma candidum]